MSFSELLSTLRAEYLQSLPTKIADIRMQISTDDRVALRTSFHKLKGTGRTYGIPEVSELAEVIEKVVLHQPDSALNAAEQGALLLEDIASAYVSAMEFNLKSDPRFRHIQRLFEPV